MTTTMTKDLAALLTRLKPERGLTLQQISDGVREHGGEATNQAVSLWASGGNISYRNARALASFLEDPAILIAAGYEVDEYETMKEQLAEQARTLDELMRQVAALERRLND